MSDDLFSRDDQRGESHNENFSKPQSYEVGYGKPPKSGQFKPGKSGNPKGRKKAKTSLHDTLHKALNEKVTVQTNKGPMKLTKAEALIQRLLNKALSGDYQASRQLLGFIKDNGLAGVLEQPMEAAAADVLAREDEAILARFGFGSSPVNAPEFDETLSQSERQSSGRGRGDEAN